ncbi:MAG: DNA repair protein RecO [Candidatus Magasanikbacteria bacterium]
MQSIILSRRDFRESDQIISLYTLEKGKQEVLARGVKKITSKNSAHLEPFSFVEVDIVPGKEIDHLTKVQPINYFVNIRKDLQKSLASANIVNLTDRLVHSGEQDERIFELLKSWLEYIGVQSSELRAHLLDGFVVKLLVLLGFDILSSDLRSEEIKKNLEILSLGSWELINNLHFEGDEQKRVHSKIYNYLVFQTERKVEDWKKCFIL